MVDVNKKIEIIKQTVYQYMVIKHPTVEEAEQGKTTEIVVNLTNICANDEKAAILQANRAIPEEHMSFISRLEVVIRPF